MKRLFTYAITAILSMGIFVPLAQPAHAAEGLGEAWACVPGDPTKLCPASQKYPLPTGNVVTWTRASGTITTGGTSQQLAAADPTRQALFVENPCNATEDLFLDFGEAASLTLSIDIPACGNVSMGIGINTQQSVTLNATTTAHAFIAFVGN